jgi:hypothetical protein
MTNRLLCEKKHYFCFGYNLQIYVEKQVKFILQVKIVNAQLGPQLSISVGVNEGVNVKTYIGDKVHPYG